MRLRKKQFRIALATAEMTQAQFASAVGVQPSYLSEVLSGKRESAPLMQKVDAFIAKHLHKPYAPLDAERGAVGGPVV